MLYPAVTLGTQQPRPHQVSRREDRNESPCEGEHKENSHGPLFLGHPLSQGEFQVCAADQPTKRASKCSFTFGLPPGLGQDVSMIRNALALLLLVLTVLPLAQAGEFKALFPKDGIPKGWVVRAWSDVSKPGPEGAQWVVEKGVLNGGGARGSWLISEADYSDLELQFEFKLGAQGNSGCALRSPASGDPAFDGLELQMADYRYNTKAAESELTGGLYRALAPRKQVYRPEKWNRYEITLKGPQVKVVLNGTVILDHDLSKEVSVIKRHNGKDAPALRDRPRKGRIGFQNLSRGGSPVLIRNARIRTTR
ncbi:MAG TPA: hypothetical protein DCQ96_13680 [Verrucomicrobiales bacterium]|nr:hypothetical protein [Verrucomicrobiales bacterium]